FIHSPFDDRLTRPRVGAGVIPPQGFNEQFRVFRRIELAPVTAPEENRFTDESLQPFFAGRHPLTIPRHLSRFFNVWWPRACKPVKRSRNCHVSNPLNYAE